VLAGLVALIEDGMVSSDELAKRCRLRQAVGLHRVQISSAAPGLRRLGLLADLAIRILGEVREEVVLANRRNSSPF